MTAILDGSYWQCDWCGRIWDEPAECLCRNRYDFWGRVHHFAVASGGITCLVCLRDLPLTQKPWLDHACGPVVGWGVGTEIKTAIESWGIKACGSCEIRSEILDKWGVQLCRFRRSDICEMLRSAAIERWLPPIGIGSIVDSAIEKTTQRQA